MYNSALVSQARTGQPHSFGLAVAADVSGRRIVSFRNELAGSHTALLRNICKLLGVKNCLTEEQVEAVSKFDVGQKRNWTKVVNATYLELSKVEKELTSNPTRRTLAVTRVQERFRKAIKLISGRYSHCSSAPKLLAIPLMPKKVKAIKTGKKVKEDKDDIAMCDVTATGSTGWFFLDHLVKYFRDDTLVDHLHKSLKEQVKVPRFLIALLKKFFFQDEKPKFVKLEVTRLGSKKLINQFLKKATNYIDIYKIHRGNKTAREYAMSKLHDELRSKFLILKPARSKPKL